MQPPGPSTPRSLCLSHRGQGVVAVRRSRGSIELLMGVGAVIAVVVAVGFVVALVVVPTVVSVAAASLHW